MACPKAGIFLLYWYSSGFGGQDFITSAEQLCSSWGSHWYLITLVGNQVWEEPANLCRSQEIFPWMFCGELLKPTLGFADIPEKHCCLLQAQQGSRACWLPWLGGDEPCTPECSRGRGTWPSCGLLPTSQGLSLHPRSSVSCRHPTSFQTIVCTVLIQTFFFVLSAITHCFSIRSQCSLCFQETWSSKSWYTFLLILIHAFLLALNTLSLICLHFLPLVLTVKIPRCFLPLAQIPGFSFQSLFIATLRICVFLCPWFFPLLTFGSRFYSS